MDTRSNMIIAKGKIITADVSYCALNPATNKWDVTFNNGHSFHYSKQNLEWLKNPVSLNPADHHIKTKDQMLDNIVAIFQFNATRSQYWHVCFSNGYEKSYDRSEIVIRSSCLADNNSKRVFDYLKRVAERVSVRTEDDTAILKKQYEKISFLDDKTATAVYLNPSEYTTSSGLETLAPIFPFGCNKSQFQAVTSALSNRFSVIEGPPGTGKTQTILNIIANLVMNGKTVQVVSNNNSAIENIIEKLSSPKYQLDFIVASLGKAEKKQNFIDRQTGKLPNLSASINDHYDSTEFYEEVKLQSQKLAEIFDLQNYLAGLKQELQAVSLEESHYIKNGINETAGIILKRHFSSSKLMQLLIECQQLIENANIPGIVGRILFWVRYGFKANLVLNETPASVEQEIQRRYYEVRKQEIENEISEIETKLAKTNANELLNTFTSASLACFRSNLAKRYSGKKRPIFESDDLWKNSEAFLKEYPVVLSTTYTARSSLGKNTIFDYVIMDEASQADVATGALALSCATNAVIVGDTKQLPNVVTSEQKPELQSIFSGTGVSSAYNFVENSFLGSVFALLGERIPRTILQEHYRCNPKIIGFCNHKFYHDELIIMTEDTENALKLVETSAGKHAKERSNLRQAEVTRDEVLPLIECSKSEIGIVVPYRNQAQTVKQIVNDPAIDIATIHKFQGREKDVIIFLTTDDIVTDFSDDPNLLNVAVSRAKKQFILVVSEEEQPLGSNTGDLIGYIKYNNGQVLHSEISSVFDYLYDHYETERLEFLKKHKRISEYDSENLMYGLIESVLAEREEPLGILTHQPLYQLIHDYSKMSEEERKFVSTGLSHLDFLIYNRVSKMPVLAIEVDGYWFHKEGTRQAERDRMKDHILELYNIPLIRFVTNGSGERTLLSEKLDKILLCKG